MAQVLKLGCAVLAVLLVTAVGSGLAPVAAQPAPGDADFEQLVQDFYGAVADRRYEDAYAYLSRGAQEQETLAEFARPFESVISIAVRSVDGVTVEGTTASLVVRTATTSRGQPLGAETCARVEWQLVLEDGQWKRASAASTAEGCAGG